MHQRLPRLPCVAAAELVAVCALCFGLLTSVHAAPLALTDGSVETGASPYTIAPVILDDESVSVDEAPVWPSAPGTSVTQPVTTKSTERTAPQPPAGQLMPQRTGAASLAAQDVSEATTDASIHSVIKESVRPAYEQLFESGALGALHDLKEDLGLNKNRWTEHEKHNAPVNSPGRWDAASGQDPAQTPRSPAQLQWDRETASLMREKLIDQITPWLIGLVALYAVGYMGKLLYRYMRSNAAKRNKRRIARAQRHASRRRRSSSPAASHTPSAPPVSVEPQETV